MLAVSGSATRLTRAQLARLRTEHRVVVVRPVAVPGTAVPDAEATGDALGEALRRAAPEEVVLLATVLDETDVVAGERLGPREAARLPVALARAVRRGLRRGRVEGLFATGGDVSAALLDALEAHGLHVEDELVPLAVAGTLVAGPWAGLPVVTKGGLVGDAGTTAACVAHLRGAAVTARRHVRAAPGA